MRQEAKKIVDALRAECFYASENDEGQSCSECPRMVYCHDKDFDIERDAADMIEKQEAEIEELRAEVSALQAERIGMVCKMETALRENAGLLKAREELRNQIANMSYAAMYNAEQGALRNGK